MMDFGFYLTPSSTIELDKVDRKAVDELARADSGFRTCIACGSCTASCTAGIFAETSVRRAILSVLNGRDEKALDLLSSCMLCGKCMMVCPRGINTRHLILSLQKYYNGK
ncbi:MAG: 4Fe-4S dicluster domain-containing protein [Bacteroidales bacterium]|nr:4Fe-4S dicluster domain-containing protein [Bacteroidales bacterium]